MLISATSIESLASDQEYRPGGIAYDATGEEFYVLADHEPAIDNPLIRERASMVPYIATAIRNKDMKRRRYAIGALGCIGDKKAIPSLETILREDSEIYYFRGDALESIYLIQPNLGKRYAAEYSDKHEYLKMSADSITRDEDWLRERCEW